VKVGLVIGYSGARIELPIRRIRRAEELGFDSAWVSESYGSDALTPLAYIGALTERIKLATGMCQLAARTPANLAMSAQTKDDMAGCGRMILGIGVSGPQIVEGWYGQPWGKPAARLRDTVEIVRKFFAANAHWSTRGSEISPPNIGPGATGLGKPLKSILHGNPDIPIMLGTSTPESIRLARSGRPSLYRSSAPTAGRCCRDIVCTDRPGVDPAHLRQSRGRGDDKGSRKCFQNRADPAGGRRDADYL
jgi:alkanesulfonate monooxygenase SsuD/methylene tetrahydromethanopterin reductase-like flavin-dependent oxidoreductase (luciferase family)